MTDFFHINDQPGIILIASNTTGSTISGDVSTSETQLGSCSIPAKYLTSGLVITAKMYWRISNSANNKIMTAYLETFGNASYKILGVTGTGRNMSVLRIMYLDPDLTTIKSFQQSNESGLGLSAQQMSVTITQNQDLTIYFGGQCTVADAGETVTLEGYEISIAQMLQA